MMEPQLLRAYRSRVDALSPSHQRGILRFCARLDTFVEEARLNRPQAEVIVEHLVRLGERRRNPANTGNIEDLFCHTLVDTGDVLRAYAQVLADSCKVVPLDSDAPLWPALRTPDGARWYEQVGDLDHLSDGDAMLVSHTMVAYGDTEMWSSARDLVRATEPQLPGPEVEQEVARMAVQSQHLPSSAFVLARAHGLTIDCPPLYAAAGYDEIQIRNAQRFYDICSEFEPRWADAFVEGFIPTDQAWTRWRRAFLEARKALPPELVYQLSSDTLTNFLEGTLESGKWTDASVFFGGVTRAEDVPSHLARIVNQYLAEHVALHDRPATELVRAVAEPLRPWGIGFSQGRAHVASSHPPKQAELQVQFEDAWARKQGHRLGGAG
ncbi:MAG TPA: hypothetical protein RMG48_12915 [Myxococcales bacterium LLY-WYZ-16_1]|nr:hypothetical protein [Myxococcales bacterium LLY-WYZ-16_1]